MGHCRPSFTHAALPDKKASKSVNMWRTSFAWLPKMNACEASFLSTALKHWKSMFKALVEAEMRRPKTHM